MIEIPEWVNRLSVERAWRYGKARMEAHDEHAARVAMRAAQARSPALMLVLEKGAVVLAQMAEEQYGETLRSSGTPYGQRVELTEPALWREAYRLADEGKPIEPLQWVYVAAAWLAGIYG